MKKTFLLCSTALFLATSCVDSLDDYNVNPKTVNTVQGVTLVANAERSLARTVTSTSVNLNPFRLFVQYWAQTTYFDESTYNITTRPIPANFWSALYRDVLADLREAKRIIPSDVNASAEEKANQLAIVEVLEVYTWATLVDTFGNIPYTQALDFNTGQPAYDDAATVYNDLLTRLDAAINQLNGASAAAGSGAFAGGELYYDGDVASWKKFANSLKLRLALNISDVDGAKAKTLAEQAAPNVIASNAENAQLNFLQSFPNTNPVWEDLVQSGRYDFVGTSVFIDRLNAVNDPRRDDYFKLINGTYTGGTYGTSNNYDAYSAPGDSQEDPTQPGVLLSYSEVEFLLAEARERGFAVGGTAATHYNNAVTASILQWDNSSAAEAATYLAQPSVAYATAPGTYKQKIGVQKWIALYGQPVDAWREYRRLDSPTLTAPAGALSALPLRLTYPVIEQNLNKANYNTAATAIGGDLVTTKIFWDRF